MRKIIYSTPANCGFLEGTLEVYSDKLTFIGKKKTIEYQFIDMTKASHSMGCLHITLKSGKTDVFNISDKKLRLEIIDYINSQLTDAKPDNQVKSDNTNTNKENIAQNTTNENQNNLNARPLNQTKASVNNSNKNSNIGGIVIAIVAVLLIGSFLFNSIFDEDDTDKKNDNSKIDEQTEKLDGMDGRWYSYDKYGLKEYDSYIVIDGKGNFYNVIGDYAFYKGSGIYIINDEKIIFYTDSNKSYEWHNCTLQTSDRMLCITSGGSAIYYQR